MAYVLVFVHLESRKVFASSATLHPTGEWMLQQSRNVRMWAEDQQIDLRFLIHDHDTKFTQNFDEAFKRDDGGIVHTPVTAPIANCYVESWIGSFKRECLNHQFYFSLEHLDHITQTYVHYHNTVRPHQGLGNLTIPQAGQPRPVCPAAPTGKICRQKWLGGLLKHYYR